MDDKVKVLFEDVSFVGLVGALVGKVNDEAFGEEVEVAEEVNEAGGLTQRDGGEGNLVQLRCCGHGK